MPEWIVSASLFVLGLVAQMAGGVSVVRSAAAIALAMRISPAVIGFAVVACAASAPELALAIQSVRSGATDLALGLVIGGNIANALLVLGATALVAPVMVRRRAIRIQMPLLILVSTIVFWMALNGRIGYLDGDLLLILLCGYLAWLVHRGRRDTRSPMDGAMLECLGDPGRRTFAHLPRQLGVLLFGLILLTVGARLVVMGAVDIAAVLGVGTLVIGLTAVALGISLSGLVSSVIGSARGRHDCAVGGLVGGSLFNLLAVLGMGAVLAPRGIPVSRAVLTLDLPIMIAAAVACLPLFFTGLRIGRLGGAVLLAYYAAYLGFVVMRASGSSPAQAFMQGLLTFVIPLTTLGVGIGVLVHPSARRRPSR